MDEQGLLTFVLYMFHTVNLLRLCGNDTMYSITFSLHLRDLSRCPLLPCVTDSIDVELHVDVLTTILNSHGSLTSCFVGNGC